MKITYRQKKTLKKWYKDFMWKYEELFFAVGWILLMFAITFCIVFGSLYLQRDTIKPEEVKTVKTTKIMVKKKNGLWNGLIISSNGDLEIDYMALRKDILVIKEKGENGIGVSIHLETTIENVDSFYIEK
jgi:hypothetical protein